MTRLCDPFSYGNGPVSRCFWNDTTRSEPRATLDNHINADIAVIGAGYTGLSAALRLAEAGRDVVVLDENQPGWGASGRNGGFCCLGGSKLGHSAMARQFGAAATRDYLLAERDAVHFVQDLVDRFDLDVDAHSRGETILAHRRRDFKGFKKDAAALADLYHVDVPIVPPDRLPSNGFSGNFFGAMTLPIGFALNPLKYALGLATAAEDTGARIFGNTAVLHLEKTNAGYTLMTPSAKVEARQVLIATNGYSRDTLPAWMAGRYMPAQSSVLVTRSLSSDELAAQGWTTGQMAYDTRNLLHYFRLMPDGRFLFGMRGGLRTSQTVNDKVYKLVRRNFERLFPQWAHVESPWHWSGFVCMAPNLTPFAGPVPGKPDLFAAFAYHGNGVAMGSYCGALLANQIIGKDDLRLPEIIRTAPGKFPGGRFRRLAMWPAYLAYALSDL